MRNSRAVLFAALPLILASSSTWAQSGASIVSLGYQTPRLPLVAPGQVLHLTLHGLTGSFDSTQVSPTIPLPTNVNGLSVSLLQSGSSVPILVPLLRGPGGLGSCNRGIAAGLIQPGNLVACSSDDATYDLTVQIPYEIKPNPPGIDNIGCASTPCQPGLPEHEQNKVGRAQLLATSFETFEQETRGQIQRILGPGGFDAERDIEAITVNRWPHGYTPEYNPLFDPLVPEAQASYVIGRARFGNITIANADSGGYGYTDGAIDQAARAVNELLSS